MAVFMIRLFCFFSLITSMLATKPARRSPSFELADFVGWHQKINIGHLIGDLVKESLLRLRQIIEIREEHDMLISYNIGMIMGRIREKYRIMHELYRQICEAYNNVTFYNPPVIITYRPHHYIITLERLHYLGMEIDKLVDVLVDEATRDLESNRTIVGQTDPPPRTRSDRETARGDEMDHTKSYSLRSQKEIIQEEAEKSLMRQRFLMQKLGNPTNMTTAKKRFLRNWPVEDTWSLDKYNYDYK